MLPWSPLPSIAGTYSGRLIICASGRCVWDDVEPFMPEIRGGTHVMTVNDLGMHFPERIRHWYSNSSDELKNWSKARRKYLERGFLLHSCNPGVKYEWPWPGHGTSGLNAVYTGLALGYDEIILCGMPLDASGHYFDPPWVKSNFQNEVPEKDGELKWWAKAVQYFEGRVKSRSGRTRDLLGD